MFPEEGLITESARNVTFHLLFFSFHIQRLLFAQGWLPQSPSPRGPPNRGDRGDYRDRSRRRSRAQREWSGASPLPPSGGPSPCIVRFHFGPSCVSNSVIIMLYTSTSFILVLTRGGYTRNVNINVYPALTPHHSDIRMCTGGASIANPLK